MTPAPIAVGIGNSGAPEAETEGGPVGLLSWRPSVRSSFFSVTARRRTVLSPQPAWLSPCRRRTVFWLVRSTNTAIASGFPTTAPISASGGGSGAGAQVGGGGRGHL